MPRPKTQFKDPEKQKAHERALERRRARHANKRTIEMASQAAEGQADFAALVEAEKQRIEDRKVTAARKGGSESPKVTVKARDDLAMAFDLMGGVPALVVWGRSNPTEFYRLWARLIPRPAEDASAALPLESLLARLAEKESTPVAQAAWEIGTELLEEGKRGAEEEDRLGLRPEDIN